MKTAPRLQRKSADEPFNILYFPAIIESGGEPGFSVFFPDIPGCISAGDTLQQAARNAEAALRGHLDLMIESGEAIPTPSEIDAATLGPDIHVAALVLIPADIPSSRVRSLKDAVAILRNMPKPPEVEKREPIELPVRDGN